jgi:hypothetical protein
MIVIKDPAGNTLKATKEDSYSAIEFVYEIDNEYYFRFFVRRGHTNYEVRSAPVKHKIGPGTKPDITSRSNSYMYRTVMLYEHEFEAIPFGNKDAVLTGGLGLLRSITETMDKGLDKEFHVPKIIIH